MKHTVRVQGYDLEYDFQISPKYYIAPGEHGSYPEDYDIDVHDCVVKATRLSLAPYMTGDSIEDKALDYHAFPLLVAFWLENYDPTPYCSHCGAMSVKACDCGPLAEND